MKISQISVPGRTVRLDLSTFDQSALDEQVDELTALPSVTLVCDMVQLREGLGKAYGTFMTSGDLPYGCLRLASSIGRISRKIVCVDNPQDENEIKTWKRVGVRPEWPDWDGSSLVWTTTQVVMSLKENASKIYLFVCGNNTYVDLMRTCKEQGKIVGCIAPLRSSRVGKVTNLADTVVDLDEVIRIEEGGVDDEDYDFTDFIRLIDSLYDRMDFIGVQYFIERQMPKRLNLKSLYTCHNVFHKAKERGIIEIGSRQNIDPNAKDVSTIELCREHPTVQLALDSAVEDDLPNSST
jgi:hypothetical protein